MDAIRAFRGSIEPFLVIFEFPYRLFLSLTGWELGLVGVLVYDLLALILIFFVLKWLVTKVWGIVFGDKLATKADVDALVSERAKTNPNMATHHSLKGAVASLKKSAQWEELADLYLGISRWKEAAKYYKKAGKFDAAANAYARAGKTEKAAGALARNGKHAAVGRIYMEAGKYGAAAKAFARADDLAAAAYAQSKAKKYAKAAAMYVDYFSSNRDDESRQLVAAKQCHELLSQDAAKKKITADVRTQLYPALAGACEREKNYELAARLYQEAGEQEKAAEAYVLAGRLQEAASAYKALGKGKEAARLGGRYYELNGRWREAAMAYAGGEEWLKAGEAFQRAEDFQRAAEYYAKAGAHARAGRMMIKTRRIKDAIGELQKVATDDKDFEVTRGMLGRCFYEMHDYAHCAATLENHLLNRRVEQDNKDYFYMLALAYEQMGRLVESRDVLYKLGAVDRSYRDVDQRLSSIDTRISLMDSQLGPVTGETAPKRKTPHENFSSLETSLGDRYELKKEIGRGGMGVVYLARDKQLDRQVALKFLGALVDNSDEYRERFLREARAAAKINHPNIIAIYDISASAGKAYIAMEYVEGPNLLDYVQRKGKLTLREAANILGQACNALHALHEIGIVHRDIKPENILLASGGTVKLMDFGLAKASDHRITKANMIMGTPCYMSPEQAQGKDTDGRSDIYSLGLLLCEMLTGDVVFKDGDVIMRQINEMPPKLSTLVPDLPTALDEFAHKAVSKDPANRFQTAREMGETLRMLMKATK